MDEILMKNVFINHSDREVDVLIEPWADQFTVAPGAKLEIQIIAQTMGIICTVMENDHLAIWLWNGCRANIILDGKQMESDSIKRPAP